MQQHARMQNLTRWVNIGVDCYGYDDVTVVLLSLIQRKGLTP